MYRSFRIHHYNLILMKVYRSFRRHQSDAEGPIEGSKSQGKPKQLCTCIHTCIYCTCTYRYRYGSACTHVPVQLLEQSLSAEISAACWLRQSFLCSELSRWSRFARCHSQFVPRCLVTALMTGIAPLQCRAVLSRSVSSVCGSSSFSSTGECVWREVHLPLAVTWACQGSPGQGSLRSPAAWAAPAGEGGRHRRVHAPEGRGGG